MKLLILLLSISLCIDAAIPRRILAFWDSKANSILEIGPVHTYLEMPLNYLGFDIIYHDIQQTLPDISERKDICGILLCFPDKTKIKNPKELLEWTIAEADRGKKIILMQNLGFLTDMQGVYTALDLQNQLFERLGFIAIQKWVYHPFNYKIIEQNQELVPFEGPLPDPLFDFNITRVNKGHAKSYLTVGIPDDPTSLSDLIIIGEKGAYVSLLYAYDVIWHLNPFRLFELVFQKEITPIPDITTLAGRRIFYATCHGDNWNGLSLIEEYKNTGISCAKVLLEKVIKPNPDIPTSVAVIAADIDPSWVAHKDSQELAREYFKLKQVESASHTYSHPFNWDFFKGAEPKKEEEFLYRYPYGTWKSSFLGWIHSQLYQLSSKNTFLVTEAWKEKFVVPRAYANEPFDLNKEISGAVKYINRFAPKNNQVKLLIWSGDSLPWSTPVLLCEKAHIKNYGGGFVRLDANYPSLLNVSSIGRKPGGAIQLYASANSDVSYTDNWQDNFFGFKYLKETLKNTDHPRRLKPIHLNYHSYSGQFLASVNALLDNIAFIKAANVIPITTSRFCDIGKGFYSVEIEPLSSSKWKIINRQGLQTLRIKKSKNVDFSESIGVIGVKEESEWLYIYLDASIDEPVIAMTPSKKESHPYLIESSWEIWNLKREDGSMSFSARGWGDCNMRWKVDKPGNYKISSSDGSSKTIPSENNEIVVTMTLPYNRMEKFTITKL